MGLDPVDFGVDVNRPGVSHALFTSAIITVLDTERSRVALHSEDVGVRSSPLFEISTRDEVPLLHEQQFGPGSHLSPSSGVFQQGEEALHF